MFAYNFIRRCNNFDYHSLRMGLVNPRKLLLLNSLVMFICAISLFVFTSLVCITFYQSAANQANSQAFSSIYNWIALGAAGFGLSILCIIGMRGAHLVMTIYKLLSFKFCSFCTFLGFFRAFNVLFLGNIIFCFTNYFRDYYMF
jgi:hypothetical protein